MVSSVRQTGLSNAADCHVHVFDTARFPYARRAAYKPPPQEAATARQLLGVLDAHGLTHALLVNPTSGYGYDNGCMLAAIARSPERFRGIARLRPTVTDRELERLSRGGVIGLRLDLVGDGVELLRGRRAARLLARLAERSWIVQIQCEKDQLAAVAPLLRESRAQLLIDHCGRPDPAQGLRQPGFRALLGLAATGRAAVKLSGAFRFSRRPWPHGDADRFAKAIVDAFTPANCVWGSDWPFLRMPMRVDYGPTLACLERWVPGAADRRRVLWSTPARLLGFKPIPGSGAR